MLATSTRSLEPKPAEKTAEANQSDDTRIVVSYWSPEALAGAFSPDED